MITTGGTGQTACSMWFNPDDFYRINRSSQPFLNALFLPAISSLTATYGLVASPYLTPAVNFV